MNAATITDLVRKLDTAWDWLDANPGHPDYRARESLWIAWLRLYEEAVDAERRRAVA